MKLRHMPEGEPSDSEDDDHRPELDPWRLDRPRGLLTEADREYLSGTSDLEPQSHGERRARERIRRRVKHALLDFEILFYCLEDRDIEQIYEQPDRVFQAVSSATPEFIGFLVRRTGEKMFDREVKKGVTRYLEREGWFADVDVSIKINYRARIDEAAERVPEEDVEELTVSDLRLLERADVIDKDRLEELADKRRSGD